MLWKNFDADPSKVRTKTDATRVVRNVPETEKNGCRCLAAHELSLNLNMLSNLKFAQAKAAL